MASANPNPVHTVRTAVHRTAIGVFRRLPLRVRRQLVRLGTPNYTLGSVVLLRDGDDRLLLVRQPPAEGWSLPGGLLDRHEHPRDAAVREVREEIGVELAPDSVTPIVPNAHVNPWVQQVDLIFTATVDAEALALSVDGVEIGEARWFALDALPTLTGPTFRLLGRAGLVAPDASPASPVPSLAAEVTARTGGAMTTSAAGAILVGGADRTDAVLAEPGEAFADPEETRSPAPTKAGPSNAQPDDEPTPTPVPAPGTTPAPAPIPAPAPEAGTAPVPAPVPVPSPEAGAAPVPAPGAAPAPAPVPAPEAGAVPVPSPEAGAVPVPSPEAGAAPAPVPAPEAAPAPVPAPGSGSAPGSEAGPRGEGA